MATVLKALTAELAALLPDVKVVMGAWEKDANEAPPRIVLVPSRDRFSAAVTARVLTGTTEPKVIATNKVGLAARIWGDPSGSEDYGFTETELLRDRFVSALVTAVGFDFTLGDGEWVGGLTDNGKIYGLSFTLDTPIVDALGQHATTTVTSEPAALTITGGDGEAVSVP